MDKFVTTRWKNVQGRAKFLERVDERKNCEDIKGEILTKSECLVYAVCEELDRLEEKIDNDKHLR